ncbi:cu(2+) suppressing and bleomycin sensitive protein 1 [Diutina catenulata]
MTRASTPVPHHHHKVPEYETKLNAQFHQVYDRLLELKNNRTKHLSSADIYSIYDEFLDLVHELKLTRKDQELKGLAAGASATDRVIDDCWQLLSLCFVTCGLTKFAPATYSSLVAVTKLLHHLRECQVYTLNDLDPINQRLQEIKEIIIQNDEEDVEDHHQPGENREKHQSHRQEESLLLRNKLSEAQSLYRELMTDFEEIPADLESSYNKLLALRKILLRYITDDIRASQPDLVGIKLQLKDIAALRGPDGKFHSKVEEHDDDKFQGLLNGLLDDCNNLLRDVAIKNDPVAPALDMKLVADASPEQTEMMKKLDQLYAQLGVIRSSLQNLYLTRRWDLRETDLYTYQRQLADIEEQRAKINRSVDEMGASLSQLSLGDRPQEMARTASETSVSRPSDAALARDQSAPGSGTATPQPLTASTYLRKKQILILYLLRRCYSLMYKLLESSEPVSESLQPIHNQLSTVRQCLLELKRVDGLSNLRELYPFQFKLASLDNLRVDGKFTINGQIPEGQGTLNALLAECFDIIYELKIELEDRELAEDCDDAASDAPAPTITQTNDDTEVETKRNRFQSFTTADYDQDSASELEEDDDYRLSDSEVEGNDYY